MVDKQLEIYRKKRDFEQTGEPSGDVAVTPSQRRRFIIQKHDATRLHYDLRLEKEGVMPSWAIPRGLPFVKSDRRLAVRVNPGAQRAQ